MRVWSDDGDSLELERADVPRCDYDFVVVARVRFRGFAGEIRAWVLRAAWVEFSRDLALLDERRQGEAKLEGMSPGALSIAVRSIDRAGHMGVEGTIGACGNHYEASLRFGLLAFDPTQLPELRARAEAIARELG